MKWTLLVLAIVSTQAFATDFSCESPRTGKTYVLSAKYGEISIYDKTTKRVIELDGLRVSYKHYRAPEADVTTFRDGEDGTVIAQIVDTPRFITGHVKKDGDLSCTITK